MWQVYLFDAIAALFIAGGFLLAVRRLERRMDRRMKKFEAWADAEEVKYVSPCEQFRASLLKADRLLAGVEIDAQCTTTTAHAPDNGRTNDGLGNSATGATATPQERNR